MADRARRKVLVETVREMKQTENEQRRVSRETSDNSLGGSKMETGREPEIFRGGYPMILSCGSFTLSVT